MADNYLEKKMDDYRRGVNSRMPRRSYSNPAAARCLTVEPHRIAVVISDGALLHAMLLALQGLPGVKVAFAGTDSRADALLAQATGSLFVPVTVLDDSALDMVMTEAMKRWGGIDTMITDMPALASSSVCVKVVAFDFNGNVTGTQRSGSQNVMAIHAASGSCDVNTLAGVALLMLASPAAAISSVTLR